MTHPIRCVREQVSQTAAEKIVARASGRGARVERTFYYPYLWYRARYSLATLFGRPRFAIDCLVDARKGLVSTTDAFETRELRPPPAEVLEVRLDAEIGATAARRTLRCQLTKRHRTAAPLGLETGPGTMLYKMFWVVRCGTEGPRVLFDSTTGRFIALA